MQGIDQLKTSEPSFAQLELIISASFKGKLSNVKKYVLTRMDLSCLTYALKCCRLFWSHGRDARIRTIIKDRKWLGSDLYRPSYYSHETWLKENFKNKAQYKTGQKIINQYLYLSCSSIQKCQSESLTKRPDRDFSDQTSFLRYPSHCGSFLACSNIRSHLSM